MCTEAGWADPTWAGGNLPEMVTHGAPLKDTVLVPAGGYVVIRFLADNPGSCLPSSEAQSTLDARHKHKQMEPAVVNGCVLPARKQHQRICVGICVLASSVDWA